MYYGQNYEPADPAREEMKRSRKIQLISIAVFLALIVGYTLWQGAGTGAMKIQWTEAHFTVTDPENRTWSVPLDELKKIAFRPQWEPGTCVDGSEDRLYRYGIWENEELGSYRLYVSKACSSVILLETASETTAFSYESDRITKELYDSILSMLNELGYSVETE